MFLASVPCCVFAPIFGSTFLKSIPVSDVWGFLVGDDYLSVQCQGTSVFLALVVLRPPSPLRGPLFHFFHPWAGFPAFQVSVFPHSPFPAPASVFLSVFFFVLSLFFLVHRNCSDFCDLRLRCPSRTPEIAAISETRQRGEDGPPPCGPPAKQSRDQLTICQASLFRLPCVSGCVRSCFSLSLYFA